MKIEEVELKLGDKITYDNEAIDYVTEYANDIKLYYKN